MSEGGGKLHHLAARRQTFKTLSPAMTRTARVGRPRCMGYHHRSWDRNQLPRAYINCNESYKTSFWRDNLLMGQAFTG
jgi:hypothetical protein